MSRHPESGDCVKVPYMHMSKNGVIKPIMINLSSTRNAHFMESKKLIEPDSELCMKTNNDKKVKSKNLLQKKKDSSRIGIISKNSSEKEKKIKKSKKTFSLRKRSNDCTNSIDLQNNDITMNEMAENFNNSSHFNSYDSFSEGLNVNDLFKEDGQYEDFYGFSLMNRNELNENNKFEKNEDSTKKIKKIRNSSKARKMGKGLVNYNENTKSSSSLNNSASSKSEPLIKNVTQNLMKDGTTNSKKNMSTNKGKSSRKKTEFENQSSIISPTEAVPIFVKDESLRENNMPLIWADSSPIKEKLDDNEQQQHQSVLAELNSPKNKKKGKKKIKNQEKKVKKELVINENRKPRKKTQSRYGRRFSVTGNWYIASGFLSDVIKLLELFEKSESWRFKNFSYLWQKLKFSLVYRGRQTFKELLEFYEEITLLTKKFLGPPHSIKRRIGALYTLYGLYYKFPLIGTKFVHVRLTLEEYKNLLDLITPFRSNPENPDPAYIFRKLESDDAILHCATSFEMCYDLHNEERDYVEIEYAKQRLAKSSAVNIVIPPELINFDCEFSDQYGNVKSQIRNELNERALSIFLCDFFSDITDTLKELQKDTLKELGIVDEDQICYTESVQLLNGIMSGNVDDHRVENTSNEYLEAFNKGKTANKSQKLRIEDEIKNNPAVVSYMKPPTDVELSKPIGMLKKAASKSLKSWVEEKINEKNKVSSTNQIQSNTGKIEISVEDEPIISEEMRQALRPKILLQKKKRGRKRPLALINAAGNPPKNKSISSIPFTKSFLDQWDESDSQSAAGLGNLSSATGVSASELKSESFEFPKETASDPMIKVKIRHGNIKKTINLKLNLTYDQFEEIQSNPIRFDAFKNKLFSLIKLTQTGDDKEKNWLIDDIEIMAKDEKDEETSSDKLKKARDLAQKSFQWSKNTNKNISQPRFECLKNNSDYSESDSESSVWSSDDNETKRKKLETEDQDYKLPENVNNDVDNHVVESDSDEYAPDNEDLTENDLSYELPTHHRSGIFKKSRQPYLKYYYSNNCDSIKAHRDSDALLEPKKKSTIQMMPVKVGNSVKYLPVDKEMLEGQDKTLLKSENEDFQEDCVPLGDENSTYTWNDFSSEKEPPFTRKYSYGFSYYFSPKCLIRTKINDTYFKPRYDEEVLKRKYKLDELKKFKEEHDKDELVKVEATAVNWNTHSNEISENQNNESNLNDSSNNRSKKLPDSYNSESTPISKSSLITGEKNKKERATKRNTVRNTKRHNNGKSVQPIKNSTTHRVTRSSIKFIGNEILPHLKTESPDQLNHWEQLQNEWDDEGSEINYLEVTGNSRADLELDDESMDPLSAADCHQDFNTDRGSMQIGMSEESISRADFNDLFASDDREFDFIGYENGNQDFVENIETVGASQNLVNENEVNTRTELNANKPVYHVEANLSHDLIEQNSSENTRKSCDGSLQSCKNIADQSQIASQDSTLLKVPLDSLQRNNLFFKVKASDGNNIFIPISSIQNKNGKSIENSNSMKSFSRGINSIENNTETNDKSMLTYKELRINNKTEVINDKFLKSSDNLNLKQIDNRDCNKLESSSKPRNRTKDAVSSNISKTNLFCKSPENVTFSKRKKSITAAACKFLFSPKMASLKNLPSSKCVASGKSLTEK